MEKYIVLDIETTGLNPWYGDKVTCICAKTSKNEWFAKVGKHENKLIEAFLDWVIAYSDHKLITKNGKMFDVPFLLTRHAVHTHTIPDCLLFFKHFDIQEITDRRVTLSDMAKILKCEEKSGKGEDAIKLFHDRRYHALKKYCKQDVQVTEQVYLRYKGLKQK